MDAPAVDGFIEQDARARRLVADDDRQPACGAGGAFEIVLMDVQLPDTDGSGRPPRFAGGNTPPVDTRGVSR